MKYTRKSNVQHKLIVNFFVNFSRETLSGFLNNQLRVKSCKQKLQCDLLRFLSLALNVHICRIVIYNILDVWGLIAKKTSRKNLSPI